MLCSVPLVATLNATIVTSSHERLNGTSEVDLDSCGVVRVENLLLKMGR